MARRIARAGLAVLALLAGSCRAEAPREPVGLFTTLAIYWPEATSVGGFLAHGQPHWARTQIERRYVIRPLDALDPDGKAGPGGLSGLDLLIAAQPRALTPQENVALDAWVRRGGRMLLFADPLLTGHSDFPLGDKRRPQDVVLLSPLLDHWGLELEFDEAQAPGVRQEEVLGVPVPVAMAGRLAARPAGHCIVLAQGLAARCAIGRGTVLVFADAALFDSDAGTAESRETALITLMNHAFGR